MEKKERIFGLDILRATAILLVIFAHLSIPFKNGIHKEFWDAVSSQTGILGVELFFVLSGFLIGTILIKLFNKEEKYNLKQIKGFWIRRWFRTLPNYYFVLILTIIVFYSLYGKIDASWTYFLFIQSPSYLVVAWSLMVEEWFYLLFPLLIFVITLFLKRNSKYKILLIAVGIIIIIPILLRILNIIDLIDLSFALKFIQNTIALFDSIGIGVLAGFLYYYHKEFCINHKKTLFFWGVLLFSFSSVGLFIFNNPGILSELLRLLDILALNFSVLLMIPSLSEMKQPRNKIFGIITYISLISYSLYLTHTTIIEVFYKTSFLTGYVRSLTSLLLAFVIAAILYHLFEKPTTALREKYV